MILFFFAATSPSFVYPLSLHDALPIYISARQVRRWRFPGGENGRFPKDCGRVAADALRVHRINGVVFGSHIQNVLGSFSRDGKLAQKERLTINLAIHRQLTHLSKRGRVHVCRRQRDFIQILPRALIVIVIGDDIGGRGRRRCRRVSVEDRTRRTATYKDSGRENRRNKDEKVKSRHTGALQSSLPAGGDAR